MKRLLLVVTALCSVLAAGQQPFETEKDRMPSIRTNGTCVIVGGTILTATGERIEDGRILVVNGKIAAIGKTVPDLPGAVVIDARGKVITPGIVDAHIHRGSDSTNEGTDSITAEVRIFDVLNLSNRNVYHAVASGETSGLILHGSANSVGGQSQVVKLKYDRPAHEAIIADAPRMIKFALGENVTRSGNAQSTRFPKTRMGVQALYRRAFTEAREYQQAWAKYDAEKAANPSAKPPRRDLRLETLKDILERKIWVQCHSYRADEMLMMVRLSQEFGFKIGALQHALEAYKIAPELAEAGVPVSIFIDNWSFKLEGYDAIPFTAALCTEAGVLVSINTDGTSGTTAIAQDAAKAMRYGGMNEDQVLQMLTINPAKQLGIDHRTGSLEVGKDADIVIWDGHPLSVYSRCAMTLIDGEVFFTRRDAHDVDRLSTIKPRLEPPSPPKFDGNALVQQVGSRKLIAIQGAKLVPVSGPAIERGNLVIRDGRIAAVGANAAIPSDAFIIDGAGLTIYPGFIDAGSTMGLSEISPIGQSNDNRELGAMQPDLLALAAIQQASAHFAPARYNGITTALTGPVGGTISGQSAVLRLDGYTSEAMGVLSPASLMVNLGPGFTFGEFDICCGDATVDELMAALGYHTHDDDCDELHSHSQRGQGAGQQATPGNITEYLDKAKEYFDARRSQPEKTPLNLGYEAMRPYLLDRKPIHANVRSVEQIRSAVNLAEKYDLNLVLVNAPDAWKVARMLAEKDIPVILTPAGYSTLGANIPVQEFDPYDTPYAVATLLHRAGVRFGFKSNDNAMAMNLPFRAAMHCAYGLPREAMIRSLTLTSAEILGIADRYGSLDPGKVANLVIAQGDPFDFDGKVLSVFIDGKPMPMTSRHTELYDTFRARLSESRSSR
ncbi:MAG: amidohydrolase family protein [Fimbriimonadaceae bacterium]